MVLAPGDSRTRWEATYINGVEAVKVLAELTHLFEARRTIKHQRPTDWIIRAYYAIEALLLDALENYELNHPHQSENPPSPYRW